LPYAADARHNERYDFVVAGVVVVDDDVQRCELVIYGGV